MIFELILLIILILINGIFSASEIAFLSTDKVDLKEKIKNGDKRAKEVNDILNNTNKFLATIQVVITFAGFLASAFAANTFVSEIMEKISYNPNYESLIENVLLVLVTMILSYLTLIFGELLPKKIALANPNKFSYKIAPIIKISNGLFYPFVCILTISVNFLTKLFNIPEPKEEKLTEEKIRRMIRLGKSEGVLEVEETDILLNVFKFNDIEVKTAMTSKAEMIKLDIKDDFKTILEIVRKEKHTRFPIFDDDKLLGIFNVKDLIIDYQSDFESLIRKPYYIDENAKIDDAFNIMKKKNIGLMIVGNKNDVKGIITMEDIIEELLGNLEDEFN